METYVQQGLSLVLKVATASKLTEVVGPVLWVRVFLVKVGIGDERSHVFLWCSTNGMEVDESR